MGGMDLRIAIPDRDVTPDVMEAGLESLTRLDEQQIVRGDVPLFKDANPGGRVVWQPEPPGAERFDHAKRVLGRGWGDCDDLAPWHAASLRVSGEDPGAKAIVVRSGPNRWHAIVKRSSGQIEDPSRAAGMPGGGVASISGIDIPPEDWCACPAVVPAMHKPGKSAVATTQTVHGLWLARADVPTGRDSRYALSAMRGHESASRAVVGACSAVLGWAKAARVLGERHNNRLTALSALCQGHEPRDVARACGVEATRDALPVARHVLGQDDERYAVIGDASVPPPQPGLASAARVIASHPSATPDQRRLAALVAKQASGHRPPTGTLPHAIMSMFTRLHGPVAPGSADEHARLLVADQTAKTLMANQQAVGFDFGNFISDVGKGIASAVKTVAPIVAKVAPIVAVAANIIPPPAGQAISLAAAGVGALASYATKAMADPAAAAAQALSQDPAVQAKLQQLTAQFPGLAAIDPTSATS